MAGVWGYNPVQDDQGDITRGCIPRESLPSHHGAKPLSPLSTSPHPSARCTSRARLQSSGSMEIMTHLDRTSHCKTSSVTSWSNRWTYRVFFISTHLDWIRLQSPPSFPACWPDFSTAPSISLSGCVAINQGLSVYGRVDINQCISLLDTRHIIRIGRDNTPRKGSRVQSTVQGYLAQNNMRPPPQDRHRALGVVPL